MTERRRQLKWWEGPLERFAESRVGGWLAVNVAHHVDKRLLKWSNGKLGVFVGQQVGLLFSTGAKSGEPRETPLLYCADEGRIVLVASNAGNRRHPAWYHNLKAHPEVEFLPRGGPRAPYVARQAEPAERAELWELVNDLYKGYDTYEERAGERVIPIMVLDPVM